jgi:hypothetical protein
MSSERNDDYDDIDNTRFFSAFTQSILNVDKSIRWIGITDQNGIIINERDREGLKPLLTIEENHHFAVNTITRHKTRLKFEPKLGELTYTFRRYTKMSRCLIPITNKENNYYLILNMDFEENLFDKIIMEKIIPLIKEKKEKFVIKKNE